MSERTLECDALHHEEGYNNLEVAVKESMKTFNGEPLFMTAPARDLFSLYLAGLPEESRQHYNCRACEEFINRYGGLVAVDHDGTPIPVVWMGDIPPFFERSVKAIIEEVMKAQIVGVFLTEQKVLGRPVTGEWTHIHAENPNPYIGVVKDAHQAMSDKRTDYLLLKKSLQAYPLDAVDILLNLLKTDSLYRSEKVIGPALWFKGLHDSIKSEKNLRTQDNLIWLAAARAPSGYCHIQNTVVGTVLDDLVAGLSFQDVATRFSAKMHPLQYQRPQAAPSAGNIARAEEIVAKLGIAPSLERRFARLEEITTIWKPAQPDTEPEQEEPGKVFGHLKPKESQPIVKEVEAPESVITWKKFTETVLPEALSIEYFAPEWGNYCGILTAEHSDAPPILQWDSPEHRNPFSWYFYHGGSPASRWGLSSGWVNVTGITLYPSMWQPGYEHQGRGAIFILEGAKDQRTVVSGNALFPETLKSELREVRSTIEAYSKQADMKGTDQASACGVGAPEKKGSKVRVKTALGHARYIIDRWD